ncbi:MAG: 4Fe-4S dicluster domain-containing protein [Bacteroidales bacterium]|nr:4Fe-4S dicluster domain-containing protein [Bacteroidales bacterium]
MIDFGFQKAKSSTVNLDNVDMRLYYALAEKEPDIKRCMECGSCTAACTSGPFNGMSLRQVIHGLQRGTDVRQMVSGCMLCGKCSMVCPRGINTRHLLLTISRIYTK